MESEKTNHFYINELLLYFGSLFLLTDNGMEIVNILTINKDF